MNPAGTQLWYACGQNRLTEVCELLLANPDVDVNHKGTGGNTPLHMLSRFGHVEILRLLLLHPKLEVNLQNDQGRTAFAVSCEQRQVESAEVLLKDPRVDLTIPGTHKWTALWIAVDHKQERIIRLMVVSGKEMDVKKKGMDLESEMSHNSIYRAELKGMSAIAELLKLADSSDSKLEAKKKALDQLKIPGTSFPPPQSLTPLHPFTPCPALCETVSSFTIAEYGRF